MTSQRQVAFAPTWPPNAAQPDRRSRHRIRGAPSGRGASEDLARRVGVRCQRWWYHSTHAVHVVLTKEYFDGLGVPRLAAWPQLLEPPDADPHVRWCGRGRNTNLAHGSSSGVQIAPSMISCGRACLTRQESIPVL